MKTNPRFNLVLFLSLFFSTTFFAQIPNPIMFCTQVPQPSDFATMMAVFGNHEGATYAAPRGGDLFILYPSGTLKNITQLNGYGENGMQGTNSISVRDPHIHWSGTKAIFSMVIGSPIQQYAWGTYYWQLYEVTGLGEFETPVITKVAHQPPINNNIEPIYGTDERIIFTTDMARGRHAHLSPQHDEYESSPIVSGIWRLNPNACTGADTLEMLTHSPSGDFTPIIDSYGRVIFTRWDHLKRDQQLAADINSGTNYGTFNYSDESATATKYNVPLDIEVFPEPVAGSQDLLALPQWANTNSHNINLFNPWVINENGTELEFLNHIGRHEMGGYFNRNFTNDPNLTEFLGVFSTNPNPVSGMLHIKESKTTPGLYYGTEAPEFSTHSCGMIWTLNAPPGESPETATFTYITHPDTGEPTSNPSPEHSGMYRNPVPLSNGEVLVLHTPATDFDYNMGNAANPQSTYEIRMEMLEPDGNYFKADGTFLTGAGISKTVSWYNPDILVSYSGLLWETFPVEIVARTKPAISTLNVDTIPTVESALFDNCGIEVEDFQRFLKRNEMALLVSRNVTSRDDLDQQQPYNLQVHNSSTKTINPNSNDPNFIYEIEYMQYLQADQIRGIGGMANPRPGRRPIPMFLHDSTSMYFNIPSNGPPGSVKIESDGSVAAFVPSERAVAWQMIDSSGKTVVRERVWLNFAAGEIRVCTSCHGESLLNQAGEMPPINPPVALTNVLNHVKTIDSDGDGVMDLYDFYPNDFSKQIGEALEEDFINNLTNWLSNDGGNNGVVWQTQTGDACNGTVAFANNYQAASAGTVDEITQMVDLEFFNQTTLHFDVAYARFDNSLFDGLRVSVLPCDGEPATIIYDKSSLDLATMPDQTSLFNPSSCSDWRTECVDLSSYAGQVFELKFENVSGGGNNLYLDNIRLIETVDSLNLSGMVQANVTTQTNSNINSTVQIQNGANVKYLAGESVLLDFEFEVELGAEFEADIRACSGNNN